MSIKFHKYLLTCLMMALIGIASPETHATSGESSASTTAAPKKGKKGKSSTTQKKKAAQTDKSKDSAQKTKTKVRTPVVRGTETLVLKAKKDSESKLYGYENVGEKYYWWAEAHHMGDGKEQLNLGLETQWVISPQYTHAAKEFTEGLAAVEINGKVGFIDRLNHIIIPPTFEPMDNLKGFRYGLAAVKKDGKFGFIDKSGKFVIDPVYDDAENFGDDYLAVVKIDKKFGCIDLTGDCVVPCTYIAKEMMKTLPGKNKAYRNAKKLAKERWDQGGYQQALEEVNATSERINKIINNPNYTEVPGTYVPANAISSMDGLYIVNESNGRFSATDTYGRPIIPGGNGSIVYDPTQRLFLVKKSITTPEDYTYDGYGLASTAGGWIIPPVFDGIGQFDANGYAPVTVGDVKGTVNVLGLVDEPFLKSLLEESIKENGVQYTRHLLGILPTCAPAHNCLGIYYASECDNLADAIHHFTVAHRLDPDNEDYKNNMKATKSTRNNRRWNRVMTGMSIAGTILSLGAVTYSVAKGAPMPTTDFGQSGSMAFDTMDYSSSGEISSSTSGSSSSGRLGKDNEALYRSQYARWEERAKDNYEALTRAGTRTSKDGKDISGTANGEWRHHYPQLKKLLREAQKEMRKIRQDARKDGITIPQSNYETVTVTN